MNRRRFLQSLAAAPMLAVAGHAAAEGFCSPNGICEVGVNLQRFQAAVQPQYQSQWCWAACIAMLFAHHRHPVNQARIVREAYGTEVNMPAVSGFVIARQLDRSWIDDNGRPFRARLGAAFDHDAGFTNLNNPMILGELNVGNPLIMGAGGHAVVLTGLRYVMTPMGPNIIGGMAVDPWPGRGLRHLTPQELVPMGMGGALRFLATAQVG